MKRRKFIETNMKLMATLPIINIAPELLIKITNENIHRIQMGKFKCTIFKDLIYGYPAKDFFINADEKELEFYLNQYKVSPENIPSPFISMLVQNGDRNVLIDSGIGFTEKPIVFRGHEYVFKGQLNNLLKEEGIDGNSITDVIISHFHPDHIGGVFSGEGSLNFPNATFHFHQKEWDFWHSSKSDDQPAMFNLFIENNITPLKNGRINLVNEDYQEICEGIKSVNAFGHTEGQIALIIGDEKEQLLFISDAFLHPLHIEKLNWQTNYDFNHEKSKASRIKLLELAYSNDMRINAFHFNFPGMGRVSKEKNNWKWIYEN